MSSQDNDVLLADTPKPRRSPPPPPPPPRISRNNSPLSAGCVSPSSSHNGHRQSYNHLGISGGRHNYLTCNFNHSNHRSAASSPRSSRSNLNRQTNLYSCDCARAASDRGDGSTTGSTTSSARIVFFESNCQHNDNCCQRPLSAHRFFSKQPNSNIHFLVNDNNECSTISSSASANGNSINDNQMCCSLTNSSAMSILCSKNKFESQPRQHYHDSNISLAPSTCCCSSSNSMRGAISHSSLNHIQHCYVPENNSSDTDFFVNGAFNHSSGNGSTTYSGIHHLIHGQNSLLNQHDYYGTSSATSTSSAGCSHSMPQNICSNNIKYRNISTARTHRPCPPTPDQAQQITPTMSPGIPSLADPADPSEKTPTIPSIPPRPPRSTISSTNRQPKPPVPSARSLPPKPTHSATLHSRTQTNAIVLSNRVDELSIETVASMSISLKPQLSPIPPLTGKNLDSRENGRTSESTFHKGCSQRAYMRFMEQHYESTFNFLREREQRRLEVEDRINKISSQNIDQNPNLEALRKLLYKKESIELRLKRQKMCINDFELIRVLGRGVIGEVSLVTKKTLPYEKLYSQTFKKKYEKKLYAMKTLNKVEVLKRNEMARVNAERDVLAEANSEYIVKLFYTFQDPQNLYFIMEYVPGGDLMTLLIKLETFKEEEARFYIAEISLAVQSVHSMGYVHRDIKPDNILIDRRGHIKLADFGQCTGFKWQHNKQYYSDLEKEKPNSDNNLFCSDNPTLSGPLEERRVRQKRRNLYSLVGSPNYMAPEVLSNAGRKHPTDFKIHQLCDWWSVGVIFYEMVVGCCPFNQPKKLDDVDKMNTFDESGNEVQLTEDQKVQLRIRDWSNYLEIPRFPLKGSRSNDQSLSPISPEARDLINKLLTDVDHRLCQNGIDDMKKHQFFGNLDWDRLRKTEAPWQPIIESELDTSNFPSDGMPPKFEYNTDSAIANLKNNEPFKSFFEFTYRRPEQKKCTNED